MHHYHCGKYARFLHLFGSCCTTSNTILEGFFKYISHFCLVSPQKVFQVQPHLTFPRSPPPRHLMGPRLTSTTPYSFIVHVADDLACEIEAWPRHSSSEAVEELPMARRIKFRAWHQQCRGCTLQPSLTDPHLTSLTLSAHLPSVSPDHQADPAPAVCTCSVPCLPITSCSSAPRFSTSVTSSGDLPRPWSLKSMARWPPGHRPAVTLPLLEVP